MLRELYIHQNNISELSALSKLDQLETLGLASNNINNITPLYNLKEIRTLDLSNNPIKKVSANITNFKCEVGWHKTWVTGITFYNNPLESPPIEIIRQGKYAINIWFEGERAFVKEVKVLLVGHGDVRKTTLVKCLTDKKTDPNEPRTNYIKISNYDIQYKQNKVKLNFWDFGGQEIMHSTHQFFLSNRSIYILVLDGRRDEDAEYWLKHIESFGGESPVLIVLNKIDSNPRYDLDRRFLQNKYPFIHSFYKTSCLGNIVGVDVFKEGLINALDHVEMLKNEWPKNWLKVKEELDDMQENFISQSIYEDICKQNGITETISREILAEYLNSLGVIVHFKELRLSDLHILQPRWASRAAYKIITSPKIIENKGFLDINWMAEIMQKDDENDFEYQKSNFPYVLDLMQKFELCYPLNDNHNHYLIPELLDIQQPELPAHQGPILNFYFKYEDLLPQSILLRFIVRMNKDIYNNFCWRTGVVLKVSIFNSLAIIIADLKERKINITVSGLHRKIHFAHIRKTFHELHANFEKLIVTEWIPLPDIREYALEYEELMGYEDSGEENYFIGKFRKTYKVNELLNGIEAENIRKDEYNWDVFLCHSSKNKYLINVIADDLKRKGIKYWLDSEQISPGDNIIGKVTEGLLKSRNIVPCISENQLKSGWSRKEYESILMRVINGTTKQRIVPLILDSTLDEDIPLMLGDIRYERYKDRDQYKRMLEFIVGKKIGLNKIDRMLSQDHGF